MVALLRVYCWCHHVRPLNDQKHSTRNAKETILKLLRPIFQGLHGLSFGFAVGDIELFSREHNHRNREGLQAITGTKDAD